ncbi:hypothetical protein AK830_g7299 [Neonectria ditissima]|uniref:Low-affinity potassium transport protein n=1 Tax=Neonectria ditissima TaxID=78410 RepID=A0A0N8H6L0_9HYPO|nr:hypothetical protein AK830_g7299 [Neonectria ditissima]
MDQTAEPAASASSDRASTNSSFRPSSRLRNIEDNEEVARLEGQDMYASTPYWQHDKAWIRRPAQLVRAVWQSRFLSRLNFIKCHYAYFIIVCLVSSLIFWGSSRPARSINYVDSLFLVVSAMTAAGLATVNLSQATTWQQVILFLLIIFGSRIWVSIWIVYSRKRRFDKRFDVIVRDARSRRRRRFSPPTGRRTSFADVAVGAQDWVKADDTGEASCLSCITTIGRNNSFTALTREQRDELGGIEYRALKLLLVLLSLYFFLCQSLGCIALGAWIYNNFPGPALDNSLKPWWLGVFNGVSAFNNSGMSLIDASMIPFQRSYFVLITTGLMILAGRTAFPILLRFIIWSQLKMLPQKMKRGEFGESSHFILDYPRRVYTYLWPRYTTWWLFVMLILLNSISWIGFILFGLGNPNIESIPTGPRVLAGLFQALSIRFGGFHITKISNLPVGLQLLYLMAMYIPAHPIKIDVDAGIVPL